MLKNTDTAMPLSPEEIAEAYFSPLDRLIERGAEVVTQTYGNKVFLRGLVEFSNICATDCLYCGIRKSNTAVDRYRLEPDTIVETVGKGFRAGLRSFVLQSGEDGYYTTAVLCDILERARKITGDDAAFTLSIGGRKKEEYRDLFHAGGKRFLMRFETADPALHKKLRNGETLDNRLKSIDDLRDVGFEIGSGFMTGLPGETDEIRIMNLELASALELDMIGIGPFIPHPDTPLNDAQSGSIDLAIKSVAALRLLLPEANIPATTAMGTLDPLGREKALLAGANVLMPNITPTKVKRKYLLYPGKICLDESGLECINCLEGRCRKIGKTLSFERGDSISWRKRNESR